MFTVFSFPETNLVFASCVLVPLGTLATDGTHRVAIYGCHQGMAAHGPIVTTSVVLSQCDYALELSKAKQNPITLVWDVPLLLVYG